MVDDHHDKSSCWVHLPSHNPSMFSTIFHSACTNSLSAQGLQIAKKNYELINHLWHMLCLNPHFLLK